MQAIEIIVIAASVLLVAFTIGYNLIKSKKKKKNCSGCSGCAYRDKCNK